MIGSYGTPPTFWIYAAEPVKAKRQSLGVYVIAFLLLFFVLGGPAEKE